MGVTAGVVVSGASDDLIEIDGAIREEFSLCDDEAGDLLAFDGGVVLRIRYSENGIWRITPVVGADRVQIDQAPEDDDDNYSDKAHVLTDPRWVVHGVGWAKA